MANLVSLWRFISRSLTVRLAVFLLVLLLLPIFLGGTLRLVDKQRNAILLDATAREGQMLTEALRDELMAFSQEGTGPLEAQLDRMASTSRSVRVFYRPDPRDGGFFSIAAEPRLSSDAIAAERERLQTAGLFEPLKTSCRGNRPIAERYLNQSGEEELLTFIRPLALENGCWIVLISHNEPDLLQSSIGQSFWKSAPFRYALITYGIIAALSAWLFIDIYLDMRRIRKAAKSAQTGTRGKTDFTKLIQVPELRGVTLEIDRLLATVDEGQDLMRRAAEENAHALKTPIAVIQQSLEPLRAEKRALQENAAISIDVIEKATLRLDTLVSAARTLDTVAADSLSAVREAVDVTEILSHLVDSYIPVAANKNVRIDLRAQQLLRALASEEMLETVLENLIENALSFAPDGTSIHVQAERVEKDVCLIVSDSGPGVPAGSIEKIFDRYFSQRPAASNGSAQLHFGLGLWIVKRNVESIGGTITAQNRSPNGLKVTVTLPAA
ncbi:MAG: HAMP domain-containing sensor histidine kinase [Pseudomonadota bacterium]